jgi:uncharacterized protein (TIGR02118 family)
MFLVQIWMRKKEGMSLEAFMSYWINEHAPLARDGYERLRGYEIKAVTRVPEGQRAPYDGVAELSWDSREDFSSDMRTEAAKSGAEDLGNFTDESGLVFIERTTIV